MVVICLFDDDNVTIEQALVAVLPSIRFNQLSRTGTSKCEEK
jgi:hypothetical protein